MRRTGRVIPTPPVNTIFFISFNTPRDGWDGENLICLRADRLTAAGGLVEGTSRPAHTARQKLASELRLIMINTPALPLSKVHSTFLFLLLLRRPAPGSSRVWFTRTCPRSAHPSQPASRRYTGDKQKQTRLAGWLIDVPPPVIIFRLLGFF